jgi:hypothetical protein
MLPSPADDGQGRRDLPGEQREALDGRGAAGGMLAAPLAESLAVIPGPSVGLLQASVDAGGCFARQLPLDLTCAAVARSCFRAATDELGLPADLVHDGVTMASELAANTLNAQGNVEFSGDRERPVSGLPEFWLYLRGSAARCELVCKIFDSDPGWHGGGQPSTGIEKAPPEAVGGRGLQVVAGLSAGQWGHHLTRGRLGSWKVAGKAVWFALRLPPTTPAAHGRPQPDRLQAANELEAMLADRGLGGSLVRTSEPGGGMTVLSVSRHLTVWNYGDTVSWRGPDGSYVRRQLSDLVDVAEQIVCAHEDLAAISSQVSVGA